MQESNYSGAMRFDQAQTIYQHCGAVARVDKRARSLTTSAEPGLIWAPGRGGLTLAAAHGTPPKPNDESCK